MILTLEQRTLIIDLLCTMTDAQIMGLALALDTMAARPTDPAEESVYNFVNAVHDLVADHVTEEA